MMWNINFYLIFLFCYTNGQIQQVPIDQQQNENGINKLKDVASEGAFPLKGKKLAPTAQWERDSEGVSRWRNGEIRYYVDPTSYDSNIKSLLEAEFAQLSSLNDCPDFNQLDSEPHDGSPWLHITNPNRERDCRHDQGQNNNGEIVVTLGYDCLKPAQILHTILHGLGFRDEVTHPQRDLFVRIQWENIQPAFRSMFRIQPAKTAALLDYDPKSIMHFHDRAYSVNGQATIVSMLPGLAVEPSGELSHLDKMKIRLAFAHECKKREIDLILNACGRQKKGDRNQYEMLIVPGKDVAGITPDNEERVDTAELIVIPGADINPDDTDGDDGIIAPGADVKSKGYQELTSGNDDTEVRPGNNEDDTGNLQSGSDDVAIPGCNVEPGSDKATDNEVTSGENNDGGVDNDGREPGVVIPGNNVGSDNNVDLDPETDQAPAGDNRDELPAGNDASDSGFEKERGVVIAGDKTDLGSGQVALRGEQYSPYS